MVASRLTKGNQFTKKYKKHDETMSDITLHWHDCFEFDIILPGKNGVYIACQQALVRFVKAGDERAVLAEKYAVVLCLSKETFKAGFHAYPAVAENELICNVSLKILDELTRKKILKGELGSLIKISVLLLGKFLGGGNKAQNGKNGDEYAEDNCLNDIGFSFHCCTSFMPIL